PARCAPGTVPDARTMRGNGFGAASRWRSSSCIRLAVVAAATPAQQHMQRPGTASGGRGAVVGQHGIKLPKPAGQLAFQRGVAVWITATLAVDDAHHTPILKDGLCDKGRYR